MSTNKKVITLDHIQCIKEYIDGTTNSSIRYAIDGELKSYINEELAAAANYIQSDYDKKHTELSNRLQYVEQHGSEEELNALKLQLDALNADTENKFNALSALETQLNQLSGDVEALEAGVSSGSVFSAGQLDEIINTALINKTKISDDMVEAPNVYTQNLVALIGKFGQINAANIIGDDISGHTIRSSSTYNGKPVWQLNHLGEGWLAKENIKWDSEGNVTFGPDVKISFNNVTDVEDKLLEAVAGIDDNIKSYVNEAVASNANSSISLSQLNDAVSMLQGEVDKAKTSAETALTTAVETLNGTISTNATAQEALSASVNAINNWLGADYNVNHATLSAQLAAVETALATAQEENNEEMESALSDLQESLTTQLESLTTQYNETSAAVSTLQSSVSNLQNSALSGEDVTDLLSTAMIDSTSVSGQEIATPTLLAKKLVALVGKFSTIEASKISGTHIQGYTISSPLEKLDNNGNVMYATDENGQPIYETVKNVDGTDMVDENGQPIYVTEINAAGEEVPIRVKQMLDIERDRDKIGWILNADGSGHLAGGAISWLSDGHLLLSNGVSINGDVKINGQAVMDGIETDASDRFNGLVGDIVANKIEATEIKTDVLETKPDGTDKVHIEDNYIHCITSEGDKTLIISSNDVDPGELDTLFNPNAVINDKVVTDIAFNATTTYQGTTYACNSSIWRSSDSVTNKNLIVNYGYTENGDPINIETSGSKIGYIYENGKINANISLTLYDVSNASFNPNNSTGVLLKDWAIAQQSPITNGWGVTNNGTTVYPSVSPVLPTTYIVGGDDTYPGATSYTIGRILIYRSDTNNGIYYKYTEQEILGIAKWGEKIPGQVRTLTINDIELADPGYYAVELCFNPNSFILLTSTTATNKNYYMHGGITTTIAQDAPANYMKIGKNGLVAFNSSTGFSIDDNNITMRARNNNKFYGIKIAPSGIYIGDGTTSWKKVDMSKLMDLGILSSN